MTLGDRPIFYITRDVERAALAGWWEYENYFIVTGDSPYARWWQEELRNIAPQCEQHLLVLNVPKMSSSDLLQQPTVMRFIHQQSYQEAVISSRAQRSREISHSAEYDEISPLPIRLAQGSLRVGRNDREGRPFILLFEPTEWDDAFCRSLGWELLNPFCKIFEQVEQKIAQVEFLKALKVRTPPVVVGTLEEIAREQGKEIGSSHSNFPRKDCGGLKGVMNTRGSITPLSRVSTGHPSLRATPSYLKRGIQFQFPSVLQYNLGHTGEGTILVENTAQILELAKQFPQRKVRVTKYIEGLPLTVNAIVGKKIYVSAPSFQITGIRELTPYRFATVGTDWSFAAKNVYAQTREAIHRIAVKIGNALKVLGFRGGFGIDFVRDEKGKLFVIEVNARQVASMGYESWIQRKIQNPKSKIQNFRYTQDLLDLRHSEALREGSSPSGALRARPSGLDSSPDSGCGVRMTEHVSSNTMLLHIEALLGIDDPNTRLPETLSGAQLFVRAQEAEKRIAEIETGWRDNVFIFSQVVEGDTVRKNEELARLQFHRGIVLGNSRLNTRALRVLHQTMPGRF